MARIDTDSDEFGSIVVCYLLDKLQDTNEQNDDNFNDLIKLLKNKGLRSILLHYYLSMPSKTRIKYRLINDVFDYNSLKNQSVIIGIRKSEKIDKEPKESSFLKKVVAIGLAKIGLNKLTK